MAKVKTHPAENEAEILARLSAAQREEWNDLKEALEWSKKRESGEAEGKTLRELRYVMIFSLPQHPKQQRNNDHQRIVPLGVFVQEYLPKAEVAMVEQISLIPARACLNPEKTTVARFSPTTVVLHPNGAYSKCARSA